MKAIINGIEIECNSSEMIELLRSLKAEAQAAAKVQEEKTPPETRQVLLSCPDDPQEPQRCCLPRPIFIEWSGVPEPMHYRNSKELFRDITGSLPTGKFSFSHGRAETPEDLVREQAKNAKELADRYGKKMLGFARRGFDGALYSVRFDQNESSPLFENPTPNNNNSQGENENAE